MNKLFKKLKENIKKSFSRIKKMFAKEKGKTDAEKRIEEYYKKRKEKLSELEEEDVNKRLELNDILNQTIEDREFRRESSQDYKASYDLKELAGKLGVSEDLLWDAFHVFTFRQPNYLALYGSDRIIKQIAIQINNSNEREPEFIAADVEEKLNALLGYKERSVDSWF